MRPRFTTAIFNYIAPLAIFFLLLDVKLRDLRQAGLPMLIMFSLGAVATMVGVLVSYLLIAPQHHGVEKSFAVAGMFTGTYIGGSVNLNAVALQYGVGKNGILFAAINAADNIITTVWIIATIVLPRVLQRVWPRKVPRSAEPAAAAVELEIPERTSVLDFSLLLALGIGSLFVSQIVSQFLPALPYILTLTTIALGLAQLPAVQRLGGAKVLGYFTVLIFLAVIGAYCDLGSADRERRRRWRAARLGNGDCLSARADSFRYRGTAEAGLGDHFRGFECEHRRRDFRGGAGDSDRA